MNRTVPAGKRLYIGGRKFLSGEMLPPFVILDDGAVLTKKQVETLAEEHEKEKKPRKRFMT